jgi:hypothetical protein
MKIAFRKTNASGFFPALFNRYTRWSLKTSYAHGGLVIGDQLWHTTPKGFLPETFKSPESWDLFDTPVSDKLALERISEYEGIRYDAFSLLGFKLPFHFSDSKRLNCFESQWLGLTGENPSTQITPDAVMAQLLRMLNERRTAIYAAADMGDGADRQGGDPLGSAPSA